jgi:hypothetical protein
MKNTFCLIAIIFYTILVVGCSPSVQPTKIPVFPTFTASPIPPTLTPESTPSSNVTPLEINGEKILLEFLQNGSSVPVLGNQDQWNVTLKPEPFILMVHGNKSIVSILALKSADILLPLQKAGGQLVVPGGTGIYFQNDLSLQDKPLEIYYEGDTLSTGEIFFSKETVNFLKTQLGVVPPALMSGHQYLDVENGFPNYTIKTINGNSIKNGQSIILVVYVQQKLPKDPEKWMWCVVKWLTFDIKFLSD